MFNIGREDRKRRVLSAEMTVGAAKFRNVLNVGRKDRRRRVCLQKRQLAQQSLEMC